MKTQHQWTKADNLLVLTEFIRFCTTTDYDALISRIAIKIGTSSASVKMKISNMVYVLSNGKYGASHYSEDSREAVFTYLKNNPEISIKRMLLILK